MNFFKLLNAVSVFSRARKVFFSGLISLCLILCLQRFSRLVKFFTEDIVPMFNHSSVSTLDCQDFCRFFFPLLTAFFSIYIFCLSGRKFYFFPVHEKKKKKKTQRISTRHLYILTIQLKVYLILNSRLIVVYMFCFPTIFYIFYA